MPHYCLGPQGAETKDQVCVGSSVLWKRGSAIRGALPRARCPRSWEVVLSTWRYSVAAARGYPDRWRQDNHNGDRPVKEERSLPPALALALPYDW